MTIVSRIRRIALLASFLAVVALLLTSNASASFTSTHTGNSRGGGPSVIPPAAFDGTISFANLTNDGSGDDVFDTGLSDFDDRFVAGASSPMFDTAASFLYLYQLVNDGPETATALRTFTVGLNGNDDTEVTSWGYFTDTGFTDSGTLIGAAFSGTTLEALGTNTAPFDGSASLGTTTAGVTDTNTGGNVPDIVATIVTGVAVGTVNDTVTFEWSGTGNIVENGERTVLVGFTSNIGPGMVNASIIDNSSPAPQTFIVSLAPMPSTGVMILAGLPIFGFAVLVRRRRHKKPAL